MNFNINEVWYTNANGTFYPGMRYKAVTTSYSAGRKDEVIEIIYCGLHPSGRASIKYIKGAGYTRVNEYGSLDLNRLHQLNTVISRELEPA